MSNSMTFRIRGTRAETVGAFAVVSGGIRQRSLAEDVASEAVLPIVRILSKYQQICLSVCLDLAVT